MKRFVLVPVACVLLAALSAAGQQAETQSQAQQTTVAAQGVSKKAFNISGRVSEDAKTFLTDKDTRWEVINPDELKNYEGQQVTIRCHLDPVGSRIQVISVNPSGVKYLARWADPAFRR